MNFTQDWFSNNISNFNKCMTELPSKKSFLEIGAFEGRATCWLLENGLSTDGRIVCVDSFTHISVDPNMDFKAVEARFWFNTAETRKGTQVVSLMKMPSNKALAELIGHRAEFDFIYVDGSHAPDVALSDACMSWGLLKQGGVMLFDDYEYPLEPTKIGIDGFLEAFGGKYKTIIKNYQYGIKKL
jgi:predicted O-methyltransferase YrrM